MWILVFLIALAVWHYVYENIVAPSVRMLLRNRVFMLRDKLRKIKMTDSRLTDEVFTVLEESLNKSITYLHALKISRFVDFQTAFEHAKALRARIEKRREIVTSCAVPEVLEIDEDLATSLHVALGINSGGWMIWIIPILLAVGFWKRVGATLRKLNLIPVNDAVRVLKIEPDRLLVTASH